MVLRKHINVLLILLMLGAQFALAQHATVHFTDHGHIEISQQDHHHDGTPKTGELCQICIFAKSITTALTADAISAEYFLPSSSYAVPFAQNYITRQASQGYLARGPPSLLI